MSGEPGYVRWQPSEYLKIAIAALPLIDKGKSVPEAFYRAQRQALQRDRHRDADEIRRLHGMGTPQKYIDQARALPESKRAELLPPAPAPAPRKPPAKRVTLDEGRDYSANGGNGGVRWITREKALLARRVLYWQKQGDTRALSRLIIEAQELEIERDRRRTPASIQTSTTGGHNAKMIEEGARHIWQIEHIPFKPDPNAAAPATDIEPNPEDEAARIEAMSMHDPEQAQAAQAAKSAVEAPIATASPPPPTFHTTRSQRLPGPLAIPSWVRSTSCSPRTPKFCSARYTLS